MDLQYLHIKDHFLFAGQDINFGGPYRFHYDEQTKALLVSENPQYIEDFFDPMGGRPEDAQISHITAIVGQNGAGKTSFLDFLRDNFPDGSQGINRTLLMAVRSEETVTLYQIGDIDIATHNLDAFHISLEQIPASYRQNTYMLNSPPEWEPVHTNAFQQTDFIYLSNVFDGNISVDVTGLRNISTNYLAYHERSEAIERQIMDNDGPEQIQTYFFGELERQINLVQHFKDMEVIPFDPPDTFRVTLKRRYFEDGHGLRKAERSAIERSQLTRLIDRIFSILSEVPYQPDNLIDRVVNFYHAQSLINFLIEFGLHLTSLSKNQPAIFGYSKFPKSASLKTFNDWLIKRLFDYSGLDTSLQKWIQTAQKIKEFSDQLRLVAENEEIFMTSEGTAFMVNTNNPNFGRFYQLYRLAFNDRPFLNFSWRNISSGERALLNLYARLYSLSDIEVTDPDNRLRDNIMLLMDEGDLYLHPEWQRQLIHLLTRFMAKAFKRQNGKPRRVQILFTTNSPIPVSDIPNSYVIFLQKAINKVLIKDSLEDKKMTFGANIHTLLADSFFLQNGLIGDFAKGKINHVIELLQGSRQDIMDNRDNLEKTIAFIGEPLIRSKLVQMMTERLQMNFVDVDQRIRRLEEEINKLKGNQS